MSGGWKRFDHGFEFDSASSDKFWATVGGVYLVVFFVMIIWMFIGWQS